MPNTLIPPGPAWRHPIQWLSYPFRCAVDNLRPLGGLEDDIDCIERTQKDIAEITNWVKDEWDKAPARCLSYLESRRTKSDVMQGFTDSVRFRMPCCRPWLHPVKYPKLMFRLHRALDRYERDSEEIEHFLDSRVQIAEVECYANGGR